MDFRTSSKRRRQRNSNNENSDDEEESPRRTQFRQNPRPRSCSRSPHDRKIKIKPDPDDGVAVPQPMNGKDENDTTEWPGIGNMNHALESSSEGPSRRGVLDLVPISFSNRIPSAPEVTYQNISDTESWEEVTVSPQRAANGTMQEKTPIEMCDEPDKDEPISPHQDPEVVPPLQEKAKDGNSGNGSSLVDSESEEPLRVTDFFGCKKLPAFAALTMRKNLDVEPPIPPQTPHYKLQNEAEEKEYNASIAVTRPIMLPDPGEPEEFPEDAPYQGRRCRYFQEKDKFKNFKFPETKGLGVYRHKDTILQAILKHNVIVIDGFTGCGKTTQVPQFILDYCVEKEQRCKIVVTQPRRIAATSVAQRVSDERGWELGSVVGYKIGMDKKNRKDTMVTYMTTGVLLNQLIHSKSFKELSHIIIDEVHERDLYSDVLLLVIKKILMEVKKEANQVKIILMSATLNADKFSEYFSTQRGRGDLAVVEAAPIIRITRTRKEYDVEEKFLDDELMHHAKIKDLVYTRESPVLNSDLYEVAVKLIISLDNDDRIREHGRSGSRDPRLGPSRYKNLKPENRGSVLVFLPGLPEINTLINYLNMANSRKGRVADPHKWNIIPLHSTTKSRQQTRVFLPPQKGHRKIILSTNLAESSITVPDVVYVIDFCLTKSMDIDPTTNFSCLRTIWASISQCTQRKGRAGRVANGKVFRLVPKTFYRTLDTHTVPEILRAGLEGVIVRLKTFGMGSPMDLLSLAINPPPLHKIKRSVVNLKELGGLTVFLGGDKESSYDTCDGNLTFMGKVMSELPIPPQCSRLIMLGHVFGVLKESIIIAAALSGVKSPFTSELLGKTKLEGYLSKQRWAMKSYSDCLAIVNLFRKWDSMYGVEVGGGAIDNNERVWADRKFADLSALKEIRTLAEELKNRIKNLGIIAPPLNPVSTLNAGEELTKEQTLLLKVVICGAFYPNYFHRHRPEKTYEYNQLRKVNNANLFSTVWFEGFPQEHDGTLYAKHIADKMGIGSEVPKVRFDGQKVFVTFDTFDTSIEKIGPISESVYRAVKFRQLKNSIRFLALPKEKEQAAKDKNRIRQDSCPPQIGLPGIDKTDCDVIVTHVESPSQFWVVYANQQEKLRQIQSAINRNMNQRDILEEDKIALGDFCLAPFSEEGRNPEYYRARIRNLTPGHAWVYFVDYGNSLRIPKEDLLSFNDAHRDQNLHQQECLAIECRLAGVKPAVLYGSVWPEIGTKKFNAFVGSDKYHLNYKIYCIVKSVIVGTLIGIPASGSVVNVNRALLKDGYGDEVPETTGDCQRNHGDRQNVEVMRDIRWMDSCNRHQIEPMSEDSYDNPPERGSVPVELKGPWSPLELDFVSLCHSSESKQVYIGGDSINSVALDHEPATPTSRLVVAASVSIQDKSRSVLARDTTMMPAVPGLMALMAMVFAPRIELRMDRDKSRYTGVLCGLGVDHNLQAIFQDHDMEITFDTSFDNEDIDRINKIRQCMNFILREDQTGNLIPSHTDAIKETFVLMKRKREPNEEHLPEEMYSWNKVPLDCIIQPPPLQEYSTGPLDVFVPHAKIAFPSRSLLLNDSWDYAV